MGTTMAALPLDEVFGFVFAGMGVLILAFVSRYVWRVSSLFRATPVSSLTGRDPGELVRISGTAKPGTFEPFTAPFSGRECLVLRYGVEERRPSFVLLPWFVTIHERAGSDAFRVRTDDGDIDIFAPSGTVSLEAEVIETETPTETPPSRVKEYQRTSTALPSTTFWRDPPSVLKPVFSRLSLGSRRFIEQCLCPQSPVTVVGRVEEAAHGVDPLLVADRPPYPTFYRMARTSALGVSIGLFSGLVGLALVVL